MPELPGGSIATRDLHFVWLCDTSGSMSEDGKMDSLNQAIQFASPEMRRAAADNAHVRLLVRTLAFSHGARWHQGDPCPIDRHEWKDLAADPLAKAVRPTADIVFLVDTSGSMGTEIAAVKRSCVAFADAIEKKGATVRLGLVGFDIGGHRSPTAPNYTVKTLSCYTVGMWPLTTPCSFKANIESLSLGLFGGGGCYLANSDSVDIFPSIVGLFDPRSKNKRIVVIISDEQGDTNGLTSIVSTLKGANITTHVLGVSGGSGAHRELARQTGGQFWDIHANKGVQTFDGLLETVGEAIGGELVRTLADGTVSTGTDLGAAFRLLDQALRDPAMGRRGLPPVLVLVSDGRPTDEWRAALKSLLDGPWGRAAIRLGIAIGKDADLSVLSEFIQHPEIKPLAANNAADLATFIRWASTVAVRRASVPTGGGWGGHLPSGGGGGRW